MPTDDSASEMLGRRRLDDLSQQLLGASFEALTPTQKSVIELVAAETPSRLAPGLEEDGDFWDRQADNVARFGGSWSFIGGFAVALALWVMWNLFGKSGGVAFDPYPFIFLNLMLSMLAAVQAPIILMSQNRQAQRDRRMAEHDYRINLRAELEIMHLHDKIDALEWRTAGRAEPSLDG